MTPLWSKTPVLSDLNIQSQKRSAGFSFAIDLFRALVPATEQNLIFSPYSIWTLLALLAEGATGETRREFAKALGIESRPQVLAERKKDYESTVAIATGIWCDHGFPIKQSFIDLARNAYGGTAETLDFAAPNAPTLINQWVLDNTRGKIGDIVNDLDPSAGMFVANAVYFKSSWFQEFDKVFTTPKPFTNSSGTHLLPAMYQCRLQQYYEDRNLQAVMLPYADRSITMCILLPRDKQMLPKICQDMNAAKLSQMFNEFDQAEVELQLPKFTLKSEFDLGPAVNTLGIERAFSGELASFENISDARPLFLSAPMHKAFAEVNEEGTEAAAVSFSAVCLSARHGSAPKIRKVRMIVDHPFLFLIMNRTTNTILFVGTVASPDTKESSEFE